MFCTSLRRRKSFASIVNSLTSPSSLGLRENDLKTHDIALSLSTHVDPTTGNSRATRVLRVLLLSPLAMSDANLTPTIERIRRFAALTGGKDLVMVFLLYAGDATSEEASNDGMVAYAKLQAEMMNHTEIPAIPILPLPKLDGLANLLKSHQTALSAPQATNKKPSSTAPFDLLRQCSNHPPVSEAAAFLLTDLFSNLREVADACTNASPDFASSSPTAGMNDKIGITEGMGEAYEMDGTFPANNTQATNDGSAHGKLKFFRDLQGDAQYRDLVEFWNVEYPV